jgi:predicted metalloprotease
VILTPRLALAALLVPLSLVLSACEVSLPQPTSTSAGQDRGDFQPNAAVSVVNDGHTRFDQQVKNAIADVQAFWRTNYPRVSGGRPYPQLRGGIYSVDGAKVSGALTRNACLRQDPTAAENNAFYCSADDSVVYDRNPDHLVAQLGDKYGSFIIAAVIAHEWGHAIQQRLGIFDSAGSQAGPPTIFTETQADCASGAFIATAQQGRTAHVSVDEQELENTLLGYLQVRDPPPVSEEQISHGNGFDRLSAMADGIAHGVSFCFGQQFDQRQFTERPFTTESDYLQRGNLPYEQIIDPTPASPDQSSLQVVLNSFWTQAASSVDKPWKDVEVQQTSDPKCPDAATSDFDYCPSDNVVYFTDQFARQSYNSLPDKRLDRSTGKVTLTDNAPADYSLGTLFVYGWSMAVRSQLFHAPIDDEDALLAASCYSGAFTASINTGQSTGFQLSPPDMDEATSAVIKLVPSDRAYGAHGTTALQRIQRFTQGYFGGLRAC